MTDDLDLAELSASFRAVLDDAAAGGEVRRAFDADDALSEPLWRKAAELGWCALTVSDRHGGLGLGADAAAALYREIGRAAAPLPMLGNLLAVEALTRAGSATLQAEWLSRLASGAVRAAIGARAVAPPWDDVRLVRRGDAVALTGLARDLLDGAGADLFVIAARDEAGAPAWVLAGKAPGTEVTGAPLIDRSRGLASVRFTETPLPATHVLEGDAEVLADALLTHASLALANESVAAAAAIFEITIAYLKTREQFGKPIGSFQALKHRCAEHKVAIEAAAALAAHATARWAAGEADAAMLAALAKAQACDMFAKVAEDAVQLHGGIGFTWEHVCHLYLKRAKLNQVLFGAASAHRDRAARLLKAAGSET